MEPEPEVGLILGSRPEPDCAGVLAQRRRVKAATVGLLLCVMVRDWDWVGRGRRSEGAATEPETRAQVRATETWGWG